MVQAIPHDPASAFAGRRWPLVTFLPFLVAMLGADSRALLAHGVDGQVVADVLVPLYLLAMFRHADRDLRLMMALIVPISLGGEVLCSLILRLYTYKSGMIPLYVPFGHAIVFSTGCLLARSPLIARWPAIRRALIAGYVLLLGAVVLALHDTLSLVLGACFLVLLHARGWQTLYLVMGVVVLCCELVGTQLGCWTWQPRALGVLEATNPPAGAVAFYIFGDILVLRAHRLVAARLPVLPQRLSRCIRRPPGEQAGQNQGRG